LSVSGYGPLRFGMTKAQAEAALGAPITGESPGGDGYCLLGRSSAAPGLVLGVVNGRVMAAMSSSDPGARSTAVTTEGVRIGTPLSRLPALLRAPVTRYKMAGAPDSTEYDRLLGSGDAEAFIVDDATHTVGEFTYGKKEFVVGAEGMCV